jgi:hypothetical protein
VQTRKRWETWRIFRRPSVSLQRLCACLLKQLKTPQVLHNVRLEKMAPRTKSIILPKCRLLPNGAHVDDGVRRSYSLITITPRKNVLDICHCESSGLPGRKLVIRRLAQALLLLRVGVDNRLIARRSFGALTGQPVVQKRETVAQKARNSHLFL